jgi:hypothetical protein
MIGIYCGLPRQGKTIFMMRDALPHLIHGRRVITNTPLWTYIKGRKVSADFYDDPEEYQFNFLHGKHCLILCDESSLYFSSLRWTKLSLDFFGKFRQAGKMRADLLCTSQSWIDTVSSLRRVADRAMLCRKRRFLIPFQLDLRYDVYDKAWGYYKKKGIVIGLPYIYHMTYVHPRFFATTAIRKETLDRYVLGKTKMYPSEARRVMKCYDHEYQITSSAVGKLHVFGKKRDQELFDKAREVTQAPGNPGADATSTPETM